MGLLSKAKSKLKSVASTVKDKIVNKVKEVVVSKTSTPSKSSGGGSGGGGGGSFGSSSAPQVNNVASVASAVAPKKVVIPTVPSGPQSKFPVNQSVAPKATNPFDKYTGGYTYTPTTTKKDASVKQLMDTINSLKNNPKGTGGPSKGGLPPLSIAELEKQGYVKKTGDNKYESTGVYEASAPSNNRSSSAIDTSFMSLGSEDYSYGLGDLGVDITNTFETSLASPTPSSSRSTSSSVGSGSSRGNGAGGASSPTSQRGSSTISARDQAIASAKAEAARLAKEVGLLSAKDESAAQGAVVSDTGEVQEESAAMNKLKDTDPSPSTKELRLLNEEIKRNDQNLKDNLSAINSSSDVAKTGVLGEQASEVGQTSVGIANAGGYLGFSGSGTGVMLKLAESHRAELTALESERQTALQEARNAAANRRFDIVRLKADAIARIDQETYERTREYNSEVKKEAEKGVEQAKKTKTQNDIFTAIQGGAKTASDIFKNLGGKTDIKEINDFLEEMTPASTKSGFKFTGNETAGFLGSGMSQDDVSALQEYVNENGYNETVRSSLTPAQRAVADEVYGRKTGSNNSTSFTTDEGVAISDTTMQVLDGFTTLKGLTPTAAAKVRSELYALGFGSDAVPKWFDAGTVTEMMGVELTQEFLEGFYKMNMEPTVLGAAMDKFTKRFISDAWKNYRSRVFAEKPGSGSGSSSGGGGLSDINEDDL